MAVPRNRLMCAQLVDIICFIMGRVSWIDTSKLGQFIRNCQDMMMGGIADRPQDMPDVFGLCGPSLIGHMGKFGT